MVAIPREMLVGQRALFGRMRRLADEGHSRVGWKVGHAIDEVAALDARVPAVGWLSSQTLLADGDVYLPRDARALRAETEVAIEVSRPVDANGDADEIGTAIAGVRVALEIVDVARGAGDAGRIIAANVFHEAVVFGRRLVAPPTAVGQATLVVNECVHDQDETAADPVRVVREVAALLAAAGESFAPGDQILSGSLVHVPIERGDRVRAEIEGLGAVGLSIAVY